MRKKKQTFILLYLLVTVEYTVLLIGLFQLYRHSESLFDDLPQYVPSNNLLVFDSKYRSNAFTENV